MIYLPVLLAISIVDIRTKRIPDRWNLLLFVIGVGHAGYLVVRQDRNFWVGIVGASLVFVGLFLIAVLTKGSLGGGDIKMATVLSLPVATIGAEKLLLAWSVIGLSCVPILAMAILRLIPRDSSIPFAPCLALGYFAALM